MIGIKTFPGAAWKILESFQVDPNLIHQAKGLGISAEAPTPGAVVLSVGTGSSHKSATVFIKAVAVKLASEGKLGPASLAVTKKNFSVQLHELIAYAKGLPIEAKFGDDSAGFPPGYKEAVEELKASVGNIKAEELSGFESADFDAFLSAVKPKATGGVDPNWASKHQGPLITSGVDFIKLFAEQPVDLPQASKCCQKVKGTSQGAIYYVAARFLGMNMALRATKNTLSVRCAGPEVKNYENMLKELGLSTHNDGEYFSAHYNVNDHALRLKTIGACIALIGYENLVELGNLKLLLIKVAEG